MKDKTTSLNRVFPYQSSEVHLIENHKTSDNKFGVFLFTRTRSVTFTTHSMWHLTHKKVVFILLFWKIPFITWMLYFFKFWYDAMDTIIEGGGTDGNKITLALNQKHHRFSSINDKFRILLVTLKTFYLL